MPFTIRPTSMQHVPRLSARDRTAVRRALVTSAVVGSALTLINQYPLLTGGGVRPFDLARVAMNYVVPLLVAVYSARASAAAGSLHRLEE